MMGRWPLLKCFTYRSFRSRRHISSHQVLWGDNMTYKQQMEDRAIALKNKHTSPNRFQKIANREDRSDIPIEAEIAQCKGRYFIQHRGCSVLKSAANDMVITNELFWNVRPATVIELGTCSGGSALWMADNLKMMEIDTTIYSIDIDLSNVEDRVKQLKPDNVHFLQGDSYEIEKTFTPEMLQSLPHPWVVNEDTHTNIYGIMKHFRKFMVPSDYFIIEDLNPFIPKHGCCWGVYADKIEYSPNDVHILDDLKKFMNEFSEEFAVDSFYTDYFGYNGTWNMHGYIKRV